MKVPDRLAKWQDVVHPIAAYYKLDPALVFAVMDRETNGRNVVGDGGMGVGLMQVDKRSHPVANCEDDTGKPLMLDPWLCVSYACRLLRRLMDAFNQDTAAALAAYNAGAGRVRRALGGLSPTASLAERLAAVDPLTTGDNYASDVIRRRDAFLGNAVLPFHMRGKS